MTYTEIQTIEAGGMPYTEYRAQPEVDEEILITIEFTPPIQSFDVEYSYSQPRFRFGDMVATKQQWEHCLLHHLNPDTCGGDKSPTKSYRTRISAILPF